MKYRKFIEKYFEIDEPKTGKLVPFKFNKVQAKYYDELCKDYDLETKGVASAAREIILKARREGFSSFVLALFAADDILSENPTETFVVSYKDDATKIFAKRYKGYVISYFKNSFGMDNPKDVAKMVFEKDNGTELVFRTDPKLGLFGARFNCGTASARTAARGGVLQKLLFSEAAHYPDTEIMTAREIIDGTLRQVDIESGLVFMETTANGYGNYYEQTWAKASRGESRFKPRFYGWRDFYSEEEFEIIKSEFTDMSMLKQEYPETPEEAFISSGTSFFDNTLIFDYIKNAPKPETEGTIDLVKSDESYTHTFTRTTDGPLKIWEKPEEFASYVIGGDTAEGIKDGDYSTLEVINNQTAKCVAKYSGRIPPDEYVNVAYALGMWYNYAYLGIEVNKDGLWVNTELFKMGYPNLYFREALDDITNTVGKKLGFRTDERTRPYILSELQRMLATQPDIWTNKDFLEECITFVRNDRGRPQAMSGKHDDEIMATAIAYEIRRNAPIVYEQPVEVPQTAQEVVKMRLAKIKAQSSKGISQNDYI